MNDAQFVFDWYPLAGIIITGIFAGLTKIKPALFAMLATRWQWVPAITLASLGAFAVAFETGEPAGAALVKGLIAGLTAIGGHHTLKRVTGQAGP